MDDIDEIISDLIFFVDHHPTFDGELVENLVEKYEDGEELTDNQIYALQNIHEKWRVKEYVEKIKFGDEE